MTIILGFGSTEKQFEENLENRIREYVAEQYSATEDLYFTEEFRNNITTWAMDLSHLSRRLGDEYRQAKTYPDRYTYYYCSVIGDASHIVFIMKYHHINRRHPMSPDGWALLRGETVFYIDTLEASNARMAA